VGNVAPLLSLNRHKATSKKVKNLSNTKRVSKKAKKITNFLVTQTSNSVHIEPKRNSSNRTYHSTHKSKSKIKPFGHEAKTNTQKNAQKKHAGDHFSSKNDQLM